MKHRPRTNNIVTTILSILLIGGFLYFFIIPPQQTAQPNIDRPFQPSKRNSGGIITRFDLRNITATRNALANKERILILTPIARWYDEYWQNLMKLSYPHELIDLGFIVPKGFEGDQVLEKLKAKLRETQGSKGAQTGKKFNLVTLLRQDVEVPMSQDEKGIVLL